MRAVVFLVAALGVAHAFDLFDGRDVSCFGNSVISARQGLIGNSIDFKADNSLGPLVISVTKTDIDLPNPPTIEKIYLVLDKLVEHVSSALDATNVGTATTVFDFADINNFECADDTDSDGNPMTKLTITGTGKVSVECFVTKGDKGVLKGVEFGPREIKCNVLVDGVTLSNPNNYLTLTAALIIDKFDLNEFFEDITKLLDDLNEKLDYTFGGECGEQGICFSNEKFEISGMEWIESAIGGAGDFPVGVNFPEFDLGNLAVNRTLELANTFFNGFHEALVKEIHFNFEETGLTSFTYDPILGYSNSKKSDASAASISVVGVVLSALIVALLF